MSRLPMQKTMHFSALMNATLSIQKFKQTPHFNGVKHKNFLIFTIGFSLRLSKNQNIIDMGYFMTDISFLFIEILFTIALILGQMKYWKIN